MMAHSLGYPTDINRWPNRKESVGISNAILKIVTFLIVLFLIVLCRINS